jgi:hypothetical protein
MVFLEVCLVAALLLLLNLYQWSPVPWVVVVLLVWSQLDYFAGRGLILGQPSHLVYFLQILALWAIYRGHDHVAGVALAVSTLKPQMGYLLVPFLLLWAFRVKRWRFASAFGLSFVMLVLVSFILEPTWFGDWLDQARLYPVPAAACRMRSRWLSHSTIKVRSMGGGAVNLIFIIPMLWGGTRRSSNAAVNVFYGQ